MKSRKWTTAFALSAAASFGLSRSTARAVDVIWNGAGNGSTWEDPNNWFEDVTMIQRLPGTGDLARIENAFTVNLNSIQSIGSFAIGHGSGVARVNIPPGAELILNNTSRVGRGTAAPGNARGEIIQTGGTLRFSNISGNRRFGLTFDSRTLPEVNADSLYSISGGQLLIEGTGSVAVGRTLNSALDPISYTRAEFRVAGSGASLIQIGGDFSFEPGGAQGDPVARFVLDANGVTTVQLGDELRLNPGSQLEIGVSSATVPTGDVTLFVADRITSATVGEGEIFDGMPDLSDVSAIFNNRLYEWTIDYQDGADDGVIDAYAKLTLPRSFRGGDANKDGLVNLQDFNVLAGNFGSTGASWTQADFNGDHLVNLQDFNILAGNFGLSGSPLGTTAGDWSALAAAVPEPSVLGLLGLGVGFIARRRHR